MDSIDKKIVNRLQDGLPVCECPFDVVAGELEIPESELLERLRTLLDNKILSRFGPMYDATRFGGFVTLVALQVAPERFDRVAKQVNRFPEVAHNYRREHTFNMWFVVSTESKPQADQVLRKIEQDTGCRVYNMPKQDEFYVNLKFTVS